MPVSRTRPTPFLTSLRYQRRQYERQQLALTRRFLWFLRQRRGAILAVLGALVVVLLSAGGAAGALAAHHWWLR